MDRSGGACEIVIPVDITQSHVNQLLRRYLFDSCSSGDHMDRNSRIPECPRCENSINIEMWKTTMDMETGAAALDAGETVCLSGDCSTCEVPLALFIKRASSDDKIGVDVWVEDRRED